MCATDSERDDLSELGLLMVSAFAIMSVLLIRLLLFLHATCLLTNSNMKTATFVPAKDTGFGQIRHRQRWLRALYRGISVASGNQCAVRDTNHQRQETSIPIRKICIQIGRHA